MNERIKELNIQALVEVLNGQDPDNDIDKMYIPAQFTKKFAELIVKDCASACIRTGILEMEESKDKMYASSIREKFEIKDDASTKKIKVGSRVKVISGFHVGIHGTVKYIEPAGRLWVIRDGASSDVFYNVNEVVLLQANNE